MGAGSEGVVEGEHLGFKLAEGYSVLLAGIFLREFKLLLFAAVAGDGYDYKVSVGQRKCGLHRIGKSGAHSLLHHKSVYDDLYAVLFILIKLYGFGELVHISVNAHAGISALTGIREDLLVHTLLRSHHGRKHHKSLACGKHHHAVDYLIHRLLLDLLAANGTVGSSNSRIKQTEIVIYLGNSTHRRTGILRRGLLIDGYGGRKSLYRINIGLIHLPDEHTGIGGKRLHKSSMSLGIEGIESKGGFSRSRKPRKDNKLVSRNGHVYIFKVVGSCAFYYYISGHIIFLPLGVSLSYRGALRLSQSQAALPPASSRRCTALS